MKEVSVIIPLYNKEKTIGNTIDSVLQQGDVVSEIIVIDDGSTDSSSAIVNKINSPKVKYFYKENGGVSSARNYGLSKANSDWVFFLDADDLLLENAVNCLISLSCRYPTANVCSANYYNIRGNVKSLGSKLETECLVSNPFKALFEFKVVPRTGCTIYSRSLLNETGGFDERISIFEDTAFDLKVLKNATLAYSPYPIYEHLFDFSELGSTLKPIDKFFVYYINLNHCSFYEKMLQIRILDWTYYKFEHSDNKVAQNFLKQKRRKYIYWLFIYKIYSKFI